MFIVITWFGYNNVMLPFDIQSTCHNSVFYGNLCHWEYQYMYLFCFCLYHCCSASFVKKNVGIQGSVGKDDISKSIFTKFNINIDKKHIELKKNIKSVGITEVDIKLGLGIHVVMRVEIIGEEPNK